MSYNATNYYVIETDRYRAIQLHDALTTDVAQSRALLRRIGIDGEIIATPATRTTASA
jgi:hypothetical protein